MNDALHLPAEQLTAHQPPALLVERALAISGTDGRVRLKPHQGLDCLQLLEACAQAMAVLMGCRLRGDGGGERASGMLVGAKAMRLVRPALAGELVEVEARQTAELGPLQLYEVRAVTMPAGEELITGELKVARSGVGAGGVRGAQLPVATAEQPGGTDHGTSGSGGAGL